MKKLLFILLSCVSVKAQVIVQPASQTEVNAGVVRTKFVSPATLAGALSNTAPQGYVVVTHNGIGTAYANIDAIVSASGDLIELYGSQSATNLFAIPTGAIVDGHGAIVLNYSTNSSASYPLFQLSDNCTVKNMVISNMFQVQGFFQSCIGFDNRNGCSAPTNFLIQSVSSYGDIDAVMLNHTNFFSGTINGGSAFSKWDCVVTQGPGLLTWNGFFSEVATFSAYTGAVLRGFVNAGATNTFSDCVFTVGGITNFTVATAYSSLTSANNFDVFKNCRFQISTANTNATGFNSNLGTKAYFFNCAFLTPTDTNACLGIRISSGASCYLYNTIIFPNLTNSQGSIINASSTFADCGGNIIQSRLIGAVAATRHLSACGDIGATALRAPNILTTNLSAEVSAIQTNTASFTITTNEFALNTFYTNVSQRSWVSVTVGLLSGVAGNAQVALFIDQEQNGSFERTGITAALTGVAASDTNQICGFIQPSGRFVFTNLSSGTGVANVQANGSEWVKF